MTSIIRETLQGSTVDVDRVVDKPIFSADDADQKVLGHQVSIGLEVILAVNSA
jgi:hypothetical protein